MKFIDNFWGHIGGCSAENIQLSLGVYCYTESKIYELDDHLVVDQNIFEFDVSVYYILMMAIPDSVYNLLE